MRNFIDPIQLPFDDFQIQDFKIKEFALTQNKSKNLICSDNSSLGILIENFQNIIRDTDSYNLPEGNINISYLPNINYYIKKIRILGEYNANRREISYFNPVYPEEQIVLIHERYHAVHHLTPDNKDNSIWTEFEGLSVFIKELLAQLFTYLYCKDFDQRYLKVFLDLNKKQDVMYQSWKIFQHYSFKQAINLYWSLREASKSSIDLGAIEKIEQMYIESILNGNVSTPKRDISGLNDSLEKIKNIKDKKIYIWQLADFLCKKGMKMSGGELACHLNRNGFYTNSGTEYIGGRGTYTLIKKIWEWLYSDLGMPEEADKIATVFVKANGSYAYK